LPNSLAIAAGYHRTYIHTYTNDLSGQWAAAESSVRRLIGTHMRFVLCRGLPEGKYPISGDRRRENYKSGELHNELHIAYMTW